MRFLDPERFQVPEKTDVPEEVVVPIEVNHNRIIVDVTVDGHVVPLMLDTGAPMTMILSGRTAEATGFDVEALDPFGDLYLTAGRTTALFAEARKKAMDKLMWDAEKGAWFDYDWKADRRLAQLTAATAYPLFAGAADAPQADRMHKRYATAADAQRIGGLKGSKRRNIQPDISTAQP